MAKPLSATMAIALAEALDHGGKLVRHAGGFWTYPNCPRYPHNGYPEWYIGASTIKALVARGELVYTEWKQGRNHNFPIATGIAPTPDREG